MSTFEVVRGAEGDCLLLDDTRISGPKPWGGGTVTKTFHTDGAYAVVPKDELDKLKAENAKLRKLAWDMWRVLDDCEESPYCVERQGKNPAVIWLEPDWSWKYDLERRMKELGIEVSS